MIYLPCWPFPLQSFLLFLPKIRGPQASPLDPPLAKIVYLSLGITCFPKLAVFLMLSYLSEERSLLGTDSLGQISEHILRAKRKSLYNRFSKKLRKEASQCRLQVVKHRYLLEFLKKGSIQAETAEREDLQYKTGGEWESDRRTRSVLRLPTGSPSSKYVVYATACVFRELYGKITDRKKNCVNYYLI